LTRKALVLVERPPREDASFAEALRMAIGLTLEVPEVEVVLGPEAAGSLLSGAALHDEEEVRRYLRTLGELGVPVRALVATTAGGGELPPCSPDQLGDLVAECGAVLVW
jgi:hypothetical protein